MIDRTQGNGAVLGIAALTAGVVGSVVSALMSRDSRRHQREFLDWPLHRDALARAGTKKTKRIIKKAQKRTPKDVDVARHRVGEFGSQVTNLAATGVASAKSRIDTGDLSSASRRIATSLKERSQGSASRAEVAGSDVAARASSLLSVARHQVPRLKKRAGKAAVDAKDRGTHLGDQVRERLPEVRDQVESRVAPFVRDVQKQAKPFLSDAAAAATTALGVAGTKAHDAREWAEKDALPDVRDALEDVSHKVAETARNAEHVIANVSSDASERLSDVGETIEGRSRQAAAVAAQGTKDTGSLLFWTTVTAGVVFYAFLSKEQREQVKAAGRRVGSEAREIYRDIQGADETFS